MGNLCKETRDQLSLSTGLMGSLTGTGCGRCLNSTTFYMPCVSVEQCF